MDKIGFLKSFDNLGRIVIPKELRERYKLGKDGEIVALKEGVLKRNSEYILVKKSDFSENSKDV